MIYSKFKNTYFFWVFILLFGLISCGDKSSNSKTHKNTKITQNLTHDSLSYKDNIKPIIISYPDDYLYLLQQKVIAVVANQTSVVQNSNQGFTHLIDTLISLKVDVKKVFAPEHGFRGKADAGEHISDGKDPKTGLSITSLYGKNRKPTQEQLKGIDIIIFDIQDVGVRFYTYISTLHYVMEASAEMEIPLIVIDRPNPNGHYIDGPTLEIKHQSFVGMHPIPIVYGMTIGEYAQMINGEKWLKDGLQCDLMVMPLKNYTYSTSYSLPIKPSPNLPNDKAINLYPSLCLFEGTSVSAGRGTEMQFQIFGAPYLSNEKFPFSFTPQANEGAKYPKFKDELCYGQDLRNYKELSKLNLNWLIDAYNATPDKENFFNPFLTKLAGTKKLRQQIESGMIAEEIRKTWQQDLDNFRKIRSKYLIYD
ncbi:MAG: DUF1343 domain-containing protein [Flavobacteriaceae bacterium]|nr:DUF1343 domain-containing protein [Flavobacteriaceae bacterium]